MEHPFIFNGKSCGRLRIEHEGVYAVFHILAENISGDLLKLSVYGEGREFYLGIAQIQNGRVDFEKRFSRAALSGLPEKIEYAAESGHEAAPETKAPKKTKSRKRSDGTLLLHDEHGEILALPTKLERAEGNCRIKIIDGKHYMLFRY